MNTVISTFPNDWQERTFAEIFDTVTDYVANGSFASLKENVSYLEEDGFAILVRTQDYTNNFKKKFIFVNEHAYNFLKKSKLFPGDIVISNVGAVGTIFKVPDLKMPMTLGPNSILVRTKEEKDFIYHLLCSDIGQKKLASITSTTAQPKFNKTDFKKLSCYLPTREEQKKIASMLTEVDSAIEKTKQIIDQTIQVKNSLTQRLLQKGVGHTVFKQTECGSIPAEWNVVELGEVAQFSQGIQVPLTKQSHQKMEGKVRFLRIVDYTQKSEDLRYIDYPGEKYIVQKNDIVMVRYGASAGYVGTGLTGAIANNLFQIKPSKMVSSGYLHMFLNQDNIYRKLNEGSGSSAMPAVNFGQVSKLKIIVPSRKEQDQMMEIFKKIEEKVEIEERRLETLFLLKKGLMQELLTGKVRVKF